MRKNYFIITIAVSACIFYLSNNLHASYYERGRTYYVYKNYDKAREMFLKEVEVNDNGDAYYFLGEIEKIQGNYGLAQEYYQKAIEKKISKKYLRLAYWNLIVLTERQGDYLSMVKSLKIFWDRTGDQGAKKKVETLINKLMWSENSEAKEVYQKGIEFKKRKKIEDAENAFREAIQKDSLFLAAKFEIGLIEYKKGSMREALYYFREIIDKIPFYGEMHLLLGDIYFTEQNYRDAKDHFSNALEYGFIGKNTKYLIRLKRGTSSYNLGDYESAKSDISEALKIHSSAVEPLILLSAIYIKENNYEEAIKTLKIAKKTNQHNPEIIFQIGSIYYRMNNTRYVPYFDKLFRLMSNKKTVPEKYYKAYILLLKKHFSDSNYKGVIDIAENLPENLRDNEINLFTAKSYFYTEQYKRAIDYLAGASLNDEERFMLCKSYAKTGITDKAKEILQQLYTNEKYFQMALEDGTLKKIASEIAQEKNRETETDDKQNQ
jgi:tetratricopeptide (TPR) repeat protein